jgi:Methyltransferase domain
LVYGVNERCADRQVSFSTPEAVVECLSGLVAFQLQVFSADMDILVIFRWVSPLFRRRRMKAFLEHLKPGSDDRILDVVGYPEFWAGSGIESYVTILNVHPSSDPAWNQKITTVVGDGTDLKYAESSFDIVFSKSVTEHLGTFERQQQLAAECAIERERFFGLTKSCIAVR